MFAAARTESKCGSQTSRKNSLVLVWNCLIYCTEHTSGPSSVHDGMFTDELLLTVRSMRYLRYGYPPRAA